MGLGMIPTEPKQNQSEVGVFNFFPELEIGLSFTVPSRGPLRIATATTVMWPTYQFL